MKYKVNCVLEELENGEYFFGEKEKLVDISFNKQVEYMYEYVRYCCYL